MTLTNDDLIAMLSNHCDKLTVLEGQLFEKSQSTGELDYYTAWLTAQNQLRLSAIELDKRQQKASS